VDAFYCTCSHGHRPAADGEVVCRPPTGASTGSTGCLEQDSCIVLLAVFLPLAALLLIALVVVVICVARHRRQRQRDKSLQMVFSRTEAANPVFELQNIETHSVTVSDQPYRY